MSIRTAILQHAISISVMRVSGPQLSDVRTIIFELRFLPYEDARPDGIPHLPDSWLIFPFLEHGKKSETDRVLAGVRTCCWKVRTNASWHRNFSIQYGVWTEWTLRPEGWCWSVYRPDGMTRRSDGWNSGQMGVRTGWLDRPDGWQGTWILLAYRLWIVESLFTTSLHLSDFVQT
jgi:hypothetical protein